MALTVILTVPVTRYPHRERIAMTDLPPTTSLDDDWCSINEAARRLGVTPTAIRNRLNRGTLEVRPNGNFGRLVYVPKPVPLTVTPTVPDTVTEPESDALERITDVLVAELRDRISELQARATAAEAERVATQQEAAQERAAMAQERERVQAALVDTTQRLDRLRETREADLNRHRQEVDELRRELDDLRRRPWWRRLWAA